MARVFNRRRFLATGTALGGLAVTARHGRAASEGPPTIACIGMGGQMMGYLLKELGKLECRIAAICDVDRRQLDSASKQAALHASRHYVDYRELLDREKDVDAVVIATPDHWHVPIAIAALESGRHVYCEKPLAHSVAECHALAAAAGSRPHLATQTGNQGCSTEGFRRSVEVIRSGLIGQVTEVHVWHPAHGWPCAIDRPDTGDAVPLGLDWDFWLGGAAPRPFKEGLYHPGKWRGWYDFGGGSLADFCCHAFQLPFRALDLGPPSRVTAMGDGLGHDAFPTRCEVTYEFPARGDRGPVRLYFRSGDKNLPPEEVTRGPAGATGCVLVGTDGAVSAGLWNTDCRVRLGTAAEFGGTDQPAVAAIPKTEPRLDTANLAWDAAKAAKGDRPRWGKVDNSHMFDWLRACAGAGKAYSPFEIGCGITELGMIGLVALKLGRPIDWDAAARRVTGLPAADSLIAPIPSTTRFFRPAAAATPRARPPA